MTFSDPSLASFPLIRPEHILDVTDVAECIVGAHDHAHLALLRRFTPRKPNAAAIRGTLVNAAFDMMVAEPDIPDDDLLHQVTLLKPLSLSAIGASVDVQAIRTMFPRLRNAIQLWGADNILVEPHVVSSAWGLQGRFDILVENEDGVDLIEMKAGNAPSHASRPNHVAQVSAYALLYSELERKPLRSVGIWYVADEKRPFRSLDPEQVFAMQRRVLTTRNGIVEHERTIGQRDFTPLRSFTGTAFATAGPSAEFEQVFATAYRNADSPSRTLAQAWISFLVREQFASRAIGARPNSQLLGLQLDISNSDLFRKHLRLHSQLPFADTSLRVGDQIVMIPHGAQKNSLLMKGAIRGMHSNELDVTLRNKQADVIGTSVWDVIQDSSDSGIRNLYPGIITFLQQPEHRRKVLIGAERPAACERVSIADDSLFADQRETVERALGSKDLFFIQGPPGTGKTSSILRALINNLHEDPTERILVVAYTNRAVAEICDVLSRSSSTAHPIHFLRHGSKDGMLASKSGDHGIPFLAQRTTPTDLAEQIRNCRCIVSTIHSMHSSPEILSFGSFTTLIVDEASQVLEPHIIGLLSITDRAILIGDQCQLPAVVTQPQDQLLVDSPILESLFVRDLSTSYFDRMVMVYKENGWEGALAMLESQGRMHQDLMQFPSTEFYESKLKPMHPWQKSTEPLPWTDLLAKRLMFFPVTVDPTRQAIAEAEVLVRLASQIYASFSITGQEFSIGIITPFRAQNNLVMSLLTKHLRDFITVDTVERFQGSQRDVILYGTAVATNQEFQTIRSESNMHGRMVDRKLNVASTRARHQFILVGNEAVLEIAESYANFIAMTRI